MGAGGLESTFGTIVLSDVLYGEVMMKAQLSLCLAMALVVFAGRPVAAIEVTGMKLWGGTGPTSPTWTWNGQAWSALTDPAWVLGVSAGSTSPLLNRSYKTLSVSDAGAYWLFAEPTTLGQHVKLEVYGADHSVHQALFAVSGPAGLANSWQRTSGSSYLSLGWAEGAANRVGPGWNLVPSGQNDFFLKAVLSEIPAAQPSPAGTAIRYAYENVGEIGSHPVFDAIETNDELTIEAWVKVDDFFFGSFPIVDKKSNITGKGWNLEIEHQAGSGAIRFSGGDGAAQANWVPELGRYYHVAVAYDRAKGYADFFVDGQPLQRVNYAGDIVDTKNQPVFLGRNITGDYASAGGELDELRIWNKALTRDEISANFNRSLTGSEDGLVGYLRFDEGFGPKLVDSSRSGLQGTFPGQWVNSGARLVPEPASGYLAAISVLFYARRRAHRRNQSPMAGIMAARSVPVAGSGTNRYAAPACSRSALL